MIRALVVALLLGSLLTSTPAAASAAPATRFRVATFNALGASHTDLPNGNETWRLRARRRTDLAVRIFQREHLDVIGLQEFQRPQHREFRRVAGRVFGLYCPPTPRSPFSGQDCVAWRRSEWTVAGRSYLGVPYFGGHRLRMPVITLRFRATGRVVTFDSVHNPTTDGTHGNEHRDRVAGWRVERARAARFPARRPVLLLGDRNATAREYLPWAPAHYHPAGRRGIDWIEGHRVWFSHYTSTYRGGVAQATDHPLVYADVALH